MPTFIPELDAKEKREKKIDALIMTILSATTRTEVNRAIAPMNRLAMMRPERKVVEEVFRQKKLSLPKEEETEKTKNKTDSTFTIGRNSSGQLVKWTFVGRAGCVPIRTISMEILPALSFDREAYKKECSKWEHKADKEKGRTNAKMNNFCG